MRNIAKYSILVKPLAKIVIKGIKYKKKKEEKSLFAITTIIHELEKEHFHIYADDWIGNHSRPGGNKLVTSVR